MTVILLASIAILAFLGWSASAAPALSSDQQRLLAARAQSTAAARRAQALEQQAAAEQDEARKARAEEAAVAARIQTAEADAAAAQARIAIINRLIARQRADLAAKQGPVVRLMAALQALARRPVLLSVAQPGSVSDMVHVRAVLATALPVVQARTADVRAGLERTRQLQRDAALAVASLGESRQRLEADRLALVRLEAEHRLKSRQFGRDALFESDRAIALGEQARDLVDLMTQASNAATVRAELEALPGPLPRPLKPGEAPSPVDALGWSHAAPPYRLPVAGRLVTGLGELSDTGVRSRGLTLETQANALVVAPAAGRVVFAKPFRDYGTVVIIDHGGAWTSLMARLADTSVAVGDKVQQGSPIGHAPTGDHPRITLELRRRDRPIDMTRLIG
ncbi:MAG: murein hydrolase activator EnvC family protein [Sphingomonas sp.]